MNINSKIQKILNHPLINHAKAECGEYENIYLADSQSAVISELIAKYRTEGVHVCTGPVISINVGLIKPHIIESVKHFKSPLLIASPTWYALMQVMFDTVESESEFCLGESMHATFTASIGDVHVVVCRDVMATGEYLLVVNTDNLKFHAIPVVKLAVVIESK
jgi:hypothetical protein